MGWKSVPLLAYTVHEAMQEPDREEFRAAMEKEWNDQINNGNFVVTNPKPQRTPRFCQLCGK
jgi:hypothetical protein